MFFGYLLQTAQLDLSRPSGPQAHVVSIVQSLRNRGHRVRVVQLDDRGIKWTDDLITWHASPYPENWRPLIRFVERPVRLTQSELKDIAPYFNIFDSLRFADAAAQVLQDVDVLFERHTFMAMGGVFLSKRTSAPLLLEVNGHPFDEMRSYGSSLSWQQRMASKFITRWTLQNATSVLPSGYGWKKRLFETGLLSHDRVHVVWPGIDFKRSSTSNNPVDIRNRWQLHRARIIAYTGTFDPWQGLDSLLQAFSTLSAEFAYVDLALAGDGYMDETLKALAAELGCESHIKFLGRLPHADIVDLLSISDIGVLNIVSHSEFVGMKLFDYMASETCPVATAPQRKHDLVIHGKTGLVVEPGDTSGLTDALRYLLAHPDECRHMATAAKEEAMYKHTWSHRAAEIEAIAAGILTAKQ